MKPFDPTLKAQATGATLSFNLQAPTLGLDAEVRLWNAGERWISVSDALGREVTGIGATARGAVVASLSWLGTQALSELLADLRLLDVSRQLRLLTVV